MTDDTSQPQGPYRAEGSSSPEVIFTIAGPGRGLGYYAWRSHPENTFKELEDAMKAARLMNLAYQEGKRERSREIKELIG